VAGHQENTMKRMLVVLAVLALAGCGAQQSSTTAGSENGNGATQAGGETGNGASGSQAVAASAPKAIDLTNQKQVFECPKCGTDYDAAGTCPTDGTGLVATQVAYSCPADGKPVEQAGKCPRCAMNAHVEKTAMAAVPADKP
jgi:predicted RNA-binding Zn-ribbon protein involved in translation (DUF1610 family)